MDSNKNLKPTLFDVNLNTDLTPIFFVGLLWFLYVSRNK
jgi:hypothetical protein